MCTNGARLDRPTRERLERNGIAIRTEPMTRLDHTDGVLHAETFARGDARPCDALFLATGQRPQSPLATSLGCAFSSRGTGNACDTNIPRVFVVGDASRDAQFVIGAAAEGVKAAVAINAAPQREELLP